MPAAQQILTPKDREGYARLTAPEHIKVEHFKLHQKIEGYYENRNVPDFMGSDRLLKADTLYGTIQLGYNPRRDQSFLFANIKTSIFDVAASRHQRELEDYQMARALKAGTQNVAYSAKRRAGSAVAIYKVNNQPWSQASIAPYLRTVDLEALRKTMPFLDQTAERRELEKAGEEQKSLKSDIAGKIAEGSYGELGQLRARQTAVSAEQDALNALLYRGNTRMRHFFRKLNYAYNMQREEMLTYYRDMRLRGKAAEMEAAPAAPNRDEENDD
jgi:hypothetical protein